MPAFKHFDPDAFLRNHADTLANLANPAKVDHASDKIAQDSPLSPLSPPLDDENRNLADAKAVADSCAHCGNAIADTDPMVIDATTGADPHPQFHAQCYEPWLIARRKVARQALSTR